MQFRREGARRLRRRRRDFKANGSTRKYQRGNIYTRTCVCWIITSTLNFSPQSLWLLRTRPGELTNYFLLIRTFPNTIYRSWRYRPLHRRVSRGSDLNPTRLAFVVLYSTLSIIYILHYIYRKNEHLTTLWRFIVTIFIAATTTSQNRNRCYSIRVNSVTINSCFDQ